MRKIAHLSDLHFGRVDLAPVRREFSHQTGFASYKRCGWLMLSSGDGIGLAEGKGTAEQGTARDHTCDIRQIG